MQKTVAIIGGGAAGMMAAVSVKEHAPDIHVVLFEKNKYLGAKVAISGGGRCNVTTGIFDVSDLLKNYPRGAKFLTTAMYHFPPQEVMRWFEEHGIPLKIESDLRVFPVSNKGKDVVKALEKTMREAEVEILLGTNVHAVRRKSDHFQVITDSGVRKVDFLVIATGGNAYRHTGSNGDGYCFAQALGHTITPLAPALNSFIVQESLMRNCAGVSLEKASLILVSPDRKYERTGAFVFTHKGVSGPAVFALSSLAAYEKYSSSAPLSLKINFFPDEKVSHLAARFEKTLTENPKKALSTILDFFLPKSLCTVFLHLAAAPPCIGAHVSKEIKTKVVHLMQNFPLTVIGQAAGDEFVTAGGVSLKEINTNTMESKICPNLYFVGEVLDVDGFTGGFNLQASWACGRLAGESIYSGGTYGSPT